MVKKRNFIIAILSAVLFAMIFYVICYARIGTGRYCYESPEVRWRLAIYTGECNDETGCFYAKRAGTGILEYFGIRPAPDNGCREAGQ
ncbi:hypothetical protein I2494_00975 [Budviciaceae bacterium BWR-B9]|uniref:Uncharacterized protein n=1 Tax=Limnobaculum allomyrinae TaxID=2791986 RepID=A0ABS1ILA8_9GAMM|nr:MULTISPECIES: hypothetical protein [Limnobaculum]MBK5142306.1 hypothetical protein [Limnobaculum allomyrinae]MBV7690809.1 hypothetical protein [Limnobaculum sp. M2-1]